MCDAIEKNLMLLSPEIAKKTGLNEAIVLQQIHYWIKHFREQNRLDHFYNDEWWVYNTYEEWNMQFPFWGIATVKRIFLKLEKYKLIVSANYNKRPYDQTKWYTINYDNLESLMNSDCINLIQWSVSNCDNGKYQSDTTNTIDYTFTFSPKTTKENGLSFDNREGKIRERIIKACEYYGYGDYYTDYLIRDIFYFYAYYYRQKNKRHPLLKQNTFNDVVKNIMESNVDDFCYPDQFQNRTHEYFRRNIPNCDYHLPHFVTDGVQEINSYGLM